MLRLGIHGALEVPLLLAGDDVESVLPGYLWFARGLGKCLAQPSLHIILLDVAIEALHHVIGLGTLTGFSPVHVE